MYTPQSFVAALPSLVLRHGRATQLTLLEPVRLSSTYITLSAVFARDTTASQTSTMNSVRDASLSSTQQECVELARYVVQGTINEGITMRWCATVQRTLCIAALFLSSSHNTEATMSENEDMCRSYCALSSFHVYLTPYLPEMHWECTSDGVLGSRHYTILHRTLQASTTNNPMSDKIHVMPGKRLREGYNTDSTEGGPAPHLPIRIAVLLNADVPTPRSNVQCVACDAAYDNGSQEAGEAAAASMIRTDATEASSCAGSEEMCIVVLHAPRARLFTQPNTSDTQNNIVTRSESGVYNDEDVFRSEAMFDFVKAFTSHYVVPRVGLQVIQAQWHKASEAQVSEIKPKSTTRKQRGKTRRKPTETNVNCKETAELEQPEHNNNTTVVVDDDVCRIGALGTSYRCYSKRGSFTSNSEALQLRNVVFVLDVPATVWRALYALHRSEPHITDAAKAERLAIATELARAMQDALVQLAADNIDLFSGAAPHNESGTTNSSSSSKSGISCAPEVMAESIARSLSRIIGRSQNAVFVREAERLLFQRTSTAAQTDTPLSYSSSSEGSVPVCRYTAEELQSAIVAQLRQHM